MKSIRIVGAAVLLFVFVVFAVGCSDDADVTLPFAGNGDSGPNDSGDPQAPDDPDDSPPLTRYTIANGCYALYSRAVSSAIVRSQDGRYAANAASAAQASGFYLKPTDLGRYMLYTEQQTLLRAAGDTIDEIDAPRTETGWAVDDRVDWTIEGDAASGFRVINDGSELALAVDENNSTLVLIPASESGERARFAFIEGPTCAEFPEFGLQATGAAYGGNGVDAPVLGIADIHNHVSATDFLGGVHVGRPFHRFGVTEALPNGSNTHGPDGRRDLVGNLYGGMPTATHDPQGWPTFADWPAFDMLTHEGTYYRWIERNYLAGLRVLNNNVVENQLLCTVTSLLASPETSPQNLTASNIRDALDGVIGQGCNPMDNAIEQIALMRRMQDYIDAQNGGPGEGWFRIVESPEAARDVINDGKLAVYLGIELSHLFDCRLTRVGSVTGDIVGCTREQIDIQLDEIYDLGVRQVNLLHEFDNGLGGNGIFNEFVLNVGNFLDTGSFWNTFDCPTDREYLYAPGQFLTSLDPLDTVAPDNPLSDLLVLIGQGLLPAYPAERRQCNSRGITELGRYALERIMDHGMLIDIDHLSFKMKGEVIEIARQRTPPYPLLSTHGGQGGISNDQARALFELGGVIYPIGHNARIWHQELERTRVLADDDFMFGFGYGADTNGLATQPTPIADPSQPVRYPFTLFDGPGWGARFDAIDPVTFERSAVPESDRYFDINTEGVSHYGLFADWVESVRIEGGAPAIDALYDSAEAFLQAWQRTRNAGTDPSS